MIKTSIQAVGRRNLRMMYTFTATSRFWFDGGLWVIYFQHRQLTLSEIGLLESILHVTAILSDVPIGIFADRFGWKLSLAIGTLLGIVYTTFALWGTNIWWFGLAFMARGLQITLTSGSDSSILYESTVWAGKKEQYLQVSGRVYAIMLVSLGISETAGGSLAGLSWSYVYIAFTIANLVSFCVVLFVREPRNSTVGAVEHPTLMSIGKRAFAFAHRCPEYVRWLGMSAVLSGFVAVFGFYGQSLLHQDGWSLLAIGILMGVENGIGAFAAAGVHRMIGRYGERGTIFLANAATAVGLILFAFVPGICSGIGYLLNSSAQNMADPIIDQGLNRLVPSEQRATLLSANSTSFSLFMMVVFPIFGIVADHFGLACTAKLFSVLGLVSIGCTALWWRNGLVKNVATREDSVD